MTGPRYAELQATSHFSFLRGASSCEELFAQAATMGIEALGVVDSNSLAGVVRAHEAARTTGVRLVVGCRLDLADGMSVLVYPMNRRAYARLCRLLSLGKGRAGKGKCRLEWPDLVAFGEGLLAVLVPDVADETCALQLRRLREVFGPRAYLALTLRRRPNDQLRLHELSNLATQMRVPTVVTNDVLFHEPGRRILQAIALHLELDRDFFAPTVENGNSVLRLLHYPPVPPEAQGAVRAAAHEDINTITLLLGAEEAGLELLARDGRWLPVCPPPGALAVNIGDMLQRLTAHRLRSTTHRVINPTGAAARRSRYSMPFFLHFRPDFVIEPLESCREGGLVEPTVTADEYLQQRLREINLV